MTEPTYNRAVIEQYYAQFTSVDRLRQWLAVWVERQYESAGHWHDRPILCQLHKEAIDAELSRRSTTLNPIHP